MSDVSDLLRDKEDLEREVAALEFKRDRIARTIEEDEKTLRIHRAAQLDMAVDWGAKQAMLQAVDDELLMLAAETESDASLESSGEETE
jgi:hypothetical protein